MAGRGPQPKPPARSQRHGGKGHRAATHEARVGEQPGSPKLLAISGGRAKAPPASRDWLPEVRKEWRELWASDLAASFEPTDVPEIRRLYRLKHDREVCQKVVDVSGRLIEGSQGQMVMNPVLRKIEGYDTQITALADRFGLNPRARLALGFTFAEAHLSLERMNQMFDEVRKRAERDDEDPRRAALQLADPNR